LEDINRVCFPVPVIQAGMQWVGYAELSSAVSNARGLGILTGLAQPTPGMSSKPTPVTELLLNLQMRIFAKRSDDVEQ
jgi:NAD(P)H-dependent flavin oxidoreductase YrpB (nitropropane dioxygenase family)